MLYFLFYFCVWSWGGERGGESFYRDFIIPVLKKRKQKCNPVCWSHLSSKEFFFSTDCLLLWRGCVYDAGQDVCAQDVHCIVGFYFCEFFWHLFLFLKMKRVQQKMCFFFVCDKVCFMFRKWVDTPRTLFVRFFTPLPQNPVKNNRSVHCPMTVVRKNQTKFPSPLPLSPLLSRKRLPSLWRT